MYRPIPLIVVAIATAENATAKKQQTKTPAKPALFRRLRAKLAAFFARA